jgi:hypothetical protein
MNQYFNELETLLMSSIPGKLSSLRCREEYFIKNKKEHLLEFLNNTYPKSWSFRDKINAAVKLKLETVEICPICNKNHKQIVYREGGGAFLSRECSKKCTAIASGIRLKEVVKNRDENKANEKRKETLLKKYGYEYNSQRPEVKEILKQPKVSNEVFQKLNNKDWLYNEYIIQKKPSVTIAKELDIYYGTVLDYCRRHGFEIQYYRNLSSEESEISDWLNSININHIQNDKSLIFPFEIDILIPNSNVGIELDGLQWHSYCIDETEKEINKHINKTLLCADKEIKLIHVTDWDWHNKKEIVQSIILSKLNKIENKLDARKCKIIEISAKESREFLNDNHIQGQINSFYKIALTYNNEIVSLLCMGKPRNDKVKLSHEYEILRFCNKKFTNVRGGFSKLLNYFIENYSPKSIITYADRMCGEGNVYKNSGFTFLRSTKPGYFWTDGNDVKISRYRVQKNVIEKLNLKYYNSNLTEEENMRNNKFRRFWDCGNNVYEWMK